MIMTLKLYNTLTRKKEIFEPIRKNEVRMYTCGPTVYDFAHIGNLRAYTFEDLLRRILEFNGFKVRHVMNITDVGHLTSDADTGEDKIEVGAKRERKTAWEVAEFFTKVFFEDIKKLNILMPHITPRATQHIEEMKELIRKLERGGYTYVIEDGIYFDTSKFRDYGVLAGLKKIKILPGARVEVVPGKKNPTDFALWKFSPSDRKRDMEWDFVLELKVNKDDYENLVKISNNNKNVQILEYDGKKAKVNFRGFPGWHIECSAMSMKYLGETFDIHCGGIDHIPIHHTNEIAQSEAATGKKFVNYWLHCAHLVVEGKKMAKSLGNYYTLRDIIERGYSPKALRYFYLNSHYREQLNFTFTALNSSQDTVNKLFDFLKKLKEIKGGKYNPKVKLLVKKMKKEFIKSINDDLNLPKALASMFNFIKEINKLIDKNQMNEKNSKEVIEALLNLDKILGLGLEEAIKEEELPEEVKKLIIERENLRKAGDFKKADEIREKILKEYGISIEDTKEEGVRWKKVKI